MAYRQQDLWEKVFHGRWSEVFITAGRVIGHLGCSGTEFYAATKRRPDYDKYTYDRVVSELCVYSKKEKGEYELTTIARKVLRPIIGPAPDSEEYRTWWQKRLVSIKDMKERGLEVVGPEVPPVPLDPEEKQPEDVKKPAVKKPRKKVAKK